MTIIGQIPPPGNPPEPLMSCNKARVFLAKLKGVKKIDHATLCRLILHEGLPKHLDPFGSGHWCLLASEISEWYSARMAEGVTPLRGPGRPLRKAV